jgi:hypothetical protein
MRLSMFAATALLTIASTNSQGLLSQAQQDPSRIAKAGLSEIAPSSIEELAKGSDVVVRARLRNGRSYVKNGQYVLTDYDIDQPQVISGSIASASVSKPLAVVPLVLSVHGGEVTINGEKITVKDDSMAMEISNGKEYLLFLTRFGTEGLNYSLYNGGIFEIEKGHASALVRNANDVFKGAAQTPVDEMVKRVQGQQKPK